MAEKTAYKLVNKPDCAELMRHALAGDERAYADLLRESARMLRPYLAKRLIQNDVAEDVLQEILISLHKARHTYDGNRPFAPWLFAIAQFRLKDSFRKIYADPLRNAGEMEEIDVFFKENVTESVYDYELVNREIGNLPKKQSAILRLIHGDGYTAKETAEKMGMSESAVKVSAHRAYKILREKFKT